MSTNLNNVESAKTTYSVKQILGKRLRKSQYVDGIIKPARVEYLVDWVEFENQPTWEPIEHLADLKEKIEIFEQNTENWEKLRNFEKNKILGLDVRKRRKRDDKEILKGNLQKHKIDEILGLKLSSFGDMLCKVSWKFYTPHSQAQAS